MPCAAARPCPRAPLGCRLQVCIIGWPSFIMSRREYGRGAHENGRRARGGGMRVTREQATQNRERIIETAARLFRERGFEGIGVADLMKEAGLTHGGFYGHFE